MKIDETTNIIETKDQKVVNESLKKGYTLIKILSTKSTTEFGETVTPTFILAIDQEKQKEMKLKEDEITTKIKIKPIPKLISSYGKHYYHLTIPYSEDTKKNCVYNFAKGLEFTGNKDLDKKIEGKFVVLSGPCGWMLRLGGQNGIELVFENNSVGLERDINLNKKNVKMKKSSGGGVNLSFMEQYFPTPECFEFNKRCMEVFRRIYLIWKKEEHIPTKEEFEIITEEIFNDQSI